MAQFDRFDICEAYSALEYDWNVGGVLQERVRPLPNSDQTYSKQVAGQLCRMKFKARPSLGGYDTLNDNAKEIYRQFLFNHGLDAKITDDDDTALNRDIHADMDVIKMSDQYDIQDEPPTAVDYKGPEAIRVYACINCPGDMSVGIPDHEIRVEIGHFYGGYDELFNCYEEGREEYRKGLQEWADTFHRECGPCEVFFGDECFECRAVHNADGSCPNESCPTNYPHDDLY